MQFVDSIQLTEQKQLAARPLNLWSNSMNVKKFSSTPKILNYHLHNSAKPSIGPEAANVDPGGDLAPVDLAQGEDCWGYTKQSKQHENKQCRLANNNLLVMSPARNYRNVKSFALRQETRLFYPQKFWNAILLQVKISLTQCVHCKRVEMAKNSIHQTALI